MTSRKSTTSNVKTNTKSTTPMQPEQLIKRSFQPLVSNKDGCARLTFAGYQHTVTKDGERAFMKLIFTCLDVTHKNPANIAVLSNYRLSAYNPDPAKMNKFTQCLLKLGYEFSEQKIVVIDEEDEFGYKLTDEENLTLQIFDFLLEQRGLVFKAALEQADNGLYRIKLDSLIPFVKNNTQVRDYESDQAFDASDLDIDMQDNADN